MVPALLREIELVRPLVAVSMCAIVALCCSGVQPEPTPATWLEQDPFTREANLLDQLGVEPRSMRLDNSLISFLDLYPYAAREPDPKTDPAILFVHGFGGTMGDFAPVLMKAAARHRVVAMDLPGFGGSFSFDDRYDIDSGVEAVRGIIDRLGLSEVHLVCHSMGGQICLSLALDDHSSLAGVTLVDAAGVYDPVAFVQGVSKRFAGVSVGSVVTERGLSSSVFVGPQQNIFKRLVTDSPGALFALSSFHENMRSQVSRVRAPVSIIWGQEDRLFPVENAVYLKENMDGAVLHVVQSAGHVPQLSHPDVVYRLIEEHHRRIKRRTRN